MSIFHAIVLGIMQGLTEFVPVSSSAHLTVVPWLFGWDDFGEDESLKNAFDVVLHLGTLVGAVAYFRRDIVRLTWAALTRPRGPDGRLAWYLALSALPAAVVGGLFARQIEEDFGEIWMVATMLLVGAIGLGWADGTPGKRELDDVEARDALSIGLGQVFALMPGLSRAGVTITLGRVRGLARDAAARFAFLMSLPIIAGAIGYKYVDVGGHTGVPADMRPAFVVGTIASAVTGYAAVWGTLRWVRTRSFQSFVLYQLILAVLIFGLLATSWR